MYCLSCCIFVVRFWFEDGIMILCSRGECESQRVCTLLPMKDFYILVLWLAEFWRILIKPVEYIMDEKATHPLLVGRKKPVLQSAIGDIKAERHERSSTLKKWPCRPEGSKHERHRPKKKRYISSSLSLKNTLSLLLLYRFPGAMSYPQNIFL